MRSGAAATANVQCKKLVRKTAWCLGARVLGNPMCYGPWFDFHGQYDLVLRISRIFANGIEINMRSLYSP